MPVSRVNARNALPNSRFGLARLMRILFAFGICVAALGTALHIYLEAATDLPKPRALSIALALTDPNSQTSLFAWFSIVTLAGVGLGFMIIFLLKRSGEEGRRAYLVLAIAAFYLSADEAATLHKMLNRAVTLVWPGRSGDFDWLVVAVPVAAVAGVALLVMARSIDRTLRNRLITAGAVFLAGAVGFEAVEAVLTQSDWGLDAFRLLLLHDLAVFFEEVLELTGSLIALWAVLAHLSVERSGRGLELSERQ
jgi:hypothetical protein